jgi:hypothetical protein
MLENVFMAKSCLALPSHAIPIKAASFQFLQNDGQCMRLFAREKGGVGKGNVKRNPAPQQDGGLPKAGIPP